MKKTLLTSIIILAALSIIPLTNAATCTYTINAQNTQAFLNEIPNINKQLQNCPVQIPNGANFLLANGNTVIDINMKAGGKESFYLTINNGQLTGITKGSGKCSQFLSTSEDNFNTILKNKKQIAPTVSNLFVSGQLGVSGCGVMSKMRVFFAKLFGKSFIKKQAANFNPNTQTTGPTGKPEYCDDTYLPGHREYAQNKEKWDEYSSDTDKVCQSQYGRGTPNPCIHTVQLSINGNPYYLCWYNE